MALPASGSGFRALPQASLAKMLKPRPHKFREERLAYYKFRPRISLSSPRHARRRMNPPDALLNSVDAQVFSLPEIPRGLFIVRPPPSVVPPEIALPIAPIASTSSEGSSVSQPPASLPTPKLRRPTNEHAAPLVGESRDFPGYRATLSAQEVEEVKRAFKADPTVEVKALAHRYRCLPSRIQMIWATVRPRVPKDGHLLLPRRTAKDAEPHKGRKAEFYTALRTAERSWRRSLW